MKKTAFLIGTLLISILATPRADAESRNEKEIRALADRFTAAFKAKDVDAIMSNYVADETLVVFDVIPPRQYSGANAYRKDWQDFFATVPGPIISAEISDLSIMIDGKIALSHCIQHAVWNDKDGKKVDVTIRVTDGYRKIGGKWLIVHEHVSAPIDLTTGLGDFSGKQ